MRLTVVGANYGSIEALSALMTSPQWLGMSRTERISAERMLLHLISNNSILNTVRGLVLNLSALVSHQDENGQNALHAAAELGKAVPLICALIKEGVDPTAINNAGQTPADVAHEAGHVLQATLLNRAAEDKRRRDPQQQTTAD